MVGRALHTDTYTALGQEVLYPAWAIYLDILGDPVTVWTGIGPFSSSSTGDPIMDGKLFTGIADIGTISAVVDGVNGSDAVTLTLPGVDLTSIMLNQVVNNAERWQMRQAYIWLITMDAAGNTVGQPIRVKSGRMSVMTCKDSSVSSSGAGGGELDGVVDVHIESHQAYASEALNSRWSEQQELDATDLSQIYVYDLANKIASLGDSMLVQQNVAAEQSVLSASQHRF